ncbi:MAG: host attachment protein [Thermoanaerobaculia bacterium]
MNEHDLQPLLHRSPTPGSRVLTVYLDTDQSKQQNRNQGFVTALRGLLREIDETLAGDDRHAFQRDAQAALRLAERHAPRGKTLVACCDASHDFTWSHELQVALPSRAAWEPTPQVRPLIEALDEYERYAVVLTDRNHARLFTVFMGEIEEHRETEAEADVRRLKASGTDQMWSQARFQRRADTHARGHLRHVAEMTDELERERGFDRLVLAGTPEALGELQRLLSRRLQTRLAGTVSLAVDSGPDQVLASTLEVEAEIERRAEDKMVGELIEAAGRDHAALGLGPTLDALPAGRVLQLVYSSAANGRGAECPECEALYADGPARCPRCGTDLIPLRDLLERLAEKTLVLGGRVEQVRGGAAERLQARAEGVGAFLRY